MWQLRGRKQQRCLEDLGDKEGEQETKASYNEGSSLTHSHTSSQKV